MESTSLIRGDNAGSKLLMNRLNKLEAHSIILWMQPSIACITAI